MKYKAGDKIKIVIIISDLIRDREYIGEIMTLKDGHWSNDPAWWMVEENKYGWCVKEFKLLGKRNPNSSIIVK